MFDKVKKLQQAIIAFTFFPVRSIVTAVNIFLLLLASLTLAASRRYWYKGWFIEWLSETISAALVALALSIFGGHIISKYMTAIKEYSRISEIPWDTLISTSRTIEVSVHGWDGLFVETSDKGPDGKKPNWTSSKRALSWIRFFRNRSHLILVLPRIPDFNHGESGDDIEEDARMALRLIAKRTGKAYNEQIREIRETTECAKALRDEADSNGSIEVRYVTNVRWICSVRFDQSTIVLSTYGYPRTVSKDGKVTNVDPSKGPSFIIDAGACSEIDKWVTELHKPDSCSFL